MTTKDPALLHGARKPLTVQRRHQHCLGPRDRNRPSSHMPERERPCPELGKPQELTEEESITGYLMQAASRFHSRPPECQLQGSGNQRQVVVLLSWVLPEASGGELQEAGLGGRWARSSRARLLESSSPVATESS